MSKTWTKLLVLPVVAVALAVAGCTSPGAAAGGGGSASADSHLASVLESKTVRIGVPSEIPPWGVLTASGEREGVDIDLANALGESLGAKVEFVNSVDESRIPLIQSNKVDAIISSFTATNERAQTIAFSEPYASNGMIFLVKTGSAITSFDDLAGKNVSAVRGTTGQTQLEENFPDSTPVLFNTFADSVQALKSGKVDAQLATAAQNRNFVANDPETLAVLDGPVLAPALMSVGVEQGDQLWLNYINVFIRNWINNGQGAASYQKWFGTEIPDTLR